MSQTRVLWEKEHVSLDKVLEFIDVSVDVIRNKKKDEEFFKKIIKEIKEKNEEKNKKEEIEKIIKKQKEISEEEPKSKKEDIEIEYGHVLDEENDKETILLKYNSKNKKENKTDYILPFIESLSFTYSRNKNHETLDIYYQDTAGNEYKVRIDYSIPFGNYMQKLEESRQDFTNLAPNKWVEKMPLSPGFYGFTYLGEQWMGVNDNLLPAQNFKTQLHEAIHTDNEYETRLITDWMLSREKPKYRN